MADVTLANRVIASHYAEPVQRVVGMTTGLHLAPSGESELIRELTAGERFDMLDDSLNWAWGYAGEDRRVGYVRSDALLPS